MSKYEETDTEIRDTNHLIAALSELGYQAESHPNGGPLVGYEGHERAERAHVIVRRSQLDRASNDIGWNFRRHTERIRPFHRIQR